MKRPTKEVGISSVDSLVDKSFDMYDAVYDYNLRLESGEELNDEEMDLLEQISHDSELLSAYAIEAAEDIDGRSVFRQGKALLNLNRAKKALTYCLVTTKEILIE
ncbi:hypothetical protein MKO06_07300 [Gramella sp. GC03-9]|uniref:Uncharacterized protein n=1 Tax=Christiangramia oceanisediminis TaxID=2920386 RepID=A0A9X2I4H9_9FLAO|nr:hypothetical protein [Gramella oceanisediminis]MCP9199705.1 hypothetical protein [Gramella oceanisediminis]